MNVEGKQYIVKFRMIFYIVVSTYEQVLSYFLNLAKEITGSKLD